MNYTLGAIEKSINNIVTRLTEHRTSGVLTAIKTILVGGRPNSRPQDITPSIVVKSISGIAKSMMIAGSRGSNTMTMPIEISIICSRLQGATNNSYASNVLFDSAGNGAIAILQNVIYALTYKTDGTFLPELGLTLDVMPIPNYYINEHAEYLEVVLTFDIAKRYYYDAIKGVSS